MLAQFDVEKDNIHFVRLSRRILTLFAILICIYIAAVTYAILTDNPSYMHDWRGATCITLTVCIFLLYAAQLRRSMHADWPPPLFYALSLWGSLYLIVLLLTLIDRSFVWEFYVVYGLGFSLFSRGRLLLAVSCMAFTLFAFEGLLVWPLTGNNLMSLASQILTIFSLTGLNMMFQYLVKERFERNHLLQRLAQTNGALEEAHRKLAQSVVQEQELAVLRERTRLAREMHDTIGHALVLISVKLEAAQRLRERDPERCEHEMEATKQIARDTMTSLRASIADLRSATWEHGQIDRALNRSARELALRTHLSVTYTCQADIAALPEKIEETLWKVSQEVFTNIEKHAHATHVQVDISQRDHRLLMSIHDDGIGLPATLMQSIHDGSSVYVSADDHYGLRGMFERIEAIDGHLTLHAGTDQGTTIEVVLPLTDCAQKFILD